jgi:two-component system LytT family sensor kinase
MAERLKVPARPLFVIATAFGLSSAGQAFWLQRLGGEHALPHLAIRVVALNLVYWYVPALLAPTIMAIAQRYQLGRVRFRVQVFIHVPGALTYSFVHTAAMLATRALLMLVFGLPLASSAGWWADARVHYLTQLDWLLMTYLFLVGLAHTLVYRRESEARALAAAHLETRLVEAQLQALQRQLHPHFLFNTLNTIAGLMRTNVNAADLMIDRLGDLLRMTLDTSGPQQVPLKQELDVLQKYLEIEQTRFESRLSIAMHIDFETLDARVPNLLLQPLVENAIRHGIAPHARPGWIAIHAAREGRRLRIEIRDSGNGLPPDRLMALNRGVGLGNTRARLDHLYPSTHQFAFSNLDDGFCVTVSIPFEVDAPAGRVEVLHAGVA